MDECDWLMQRDMHARDIAKYGIVLEGWKVHVNSEGIEKEDKEFKEMTPISANELGSRC